MKKLTGLKTLNNSLDDMLEEISKFYKSQINNIKKEYQKKVFEERLQIISEIAQGENMDEIELKNKYLYNKKKKSVTKPEVIKAQTNLLSVLTYDGEDFYFEDKEDGNVFNKDSEKVGVYLEGKIVFDSVQ